MKNLIFLCIASLFLTACPPKAESVYDKVEYSAITRGFSENIIIDRENNEEVKITYKSNDQVKVQRLLTKKEFQSLLSALRYIDVNTVDKIEPPSKRHAYDAAKFTRIIFTVKDKEYKSVGFDDDNPPKELSSLIQLLYSFTK